MQANTELVRSLSILPDHHTGLLVGGAAYLDVSILAAINFSPHILGLNISSFSWPSLDHHIITCHQDRNKLLQFKCLSQLEPNLVFFFYIRSFVVTQRQTLLQFPSFSEKLKPREAGITKKCWFGLPPSLQLSTPLGFLNFKASFYQMNFTKVPAESFFDASIRPELPRKFN